MRGKGWAEEVRKLLNEWVEELGRGFSLKYRLPAPVAFARAADPLWAEIRNLHPWMATPQELLPEADTIIVFAVPLTLEAVRSNVEGAEPSVEWLRDYAYTSRVIDEVSRRLAEFLEREGYASVALRATHDFDPKRLAASWSHRHAGYIAGLGTFGANRLLITEKGCAVRLGSVVTELGVEPTPRPRFEYCLEKRGLPCGRCRGRCPIGAFDDWERKKFECWRKQLQTCEENRELVKAFGYPVDACGKCSVAVPCATEIPRAAAV